jgi:hypothetical protein
MLPFSGIYAQLGEAGRDGLKLAACRTNAQQA